MNIKQNLGILAQRISRSRNATRTFMMGLNPMPEKVNESSLIQKLVITPLCKMLSSETGANVSARKGVSPRIFWLLANGKKFAILSSSNIKYIDNQLVTVIKIQMICKCKYKTI